MATYYINADTGDDGSGDGSSGNPWETLAKFISSSAANDTCVCQTSTANYAWVSATINNRTIQAESYQSRAVFDGGSSAVQWFLQNNVTLIDIEFQNAYHVSNSFKAVFDLGRYGGTVIFTRCVFENIEHGCQTFSGGFMGVSDGGSFLPYNLTLTSCLFKDLVARSDSAIHLLFFLKSSTGGCTITANSNIFTFVTNSGFQVDTVFYSSSGSHTRVAKNNCFYNISGTTINISTVDTYNNNCAYLMSTVPSGTGNITDDPLFVDAPNGNFNLRPTSPCIDTGTLV